MSASHSAQRRSALGPSRSALALAGLAAAAGLLLAGCAGAAPEGADPDVDGSAGGATSETEAAPVDAPCADPFGPDSTVVADAAGAYAREVLGADYMRGGESISLIDCTDDEATLYRAFEDDSGVVIMHHDGTAWTFVADYPREQACADPALAARVPALEC